MVAAEALPTFPIAIIRVHINGTEKDRNKKKIKVRETTSEARNVLHYIIYNMWVDFCVVKTMDCTFIWTVAT